MARGFWFSRWFIVLGVLIPIWGYLNLSGYASSESFLWNAVNQNVIVSLLPQENFLICTQNFLRRFIMTPFGFEVEPKPIVCMRPMLIAYVNVLGFSLFILFTGIYTLIRSGSEFDPYADLKKEMAQKEVRKVRKKSAPSSHE
jgi:hypothetical protein